MQSIAIKTLLHFNVQLNWEFVSMNNTALFTYITDNVGVCTGCEDGDGITLHLKFFCFCLFPFKLVASLKPHVKITH